MIKTRRVVAVGSEVLRLAASERHSLAVIVEAMWDEEEE
jgi:hypothetical protein